MIKKIVEKMQKFMVLVAMLLLGLEAQAQMALPPLDVIEEDGVQYQRVRTLRQFLQIPCAQVKYEGRTIPVALFQQANPQALNGQNLPEGTMLTFALYAKCKYRSGNKRKCRKSGTGCACGFVDVDDDDFLDGEFIVTPGKNDGATGVYYNATLDEILIR